MSIDDDTRSWVGNGSDVVDTLSAAPDAWQFGLVRVRLPIAKRCFDLIVGTLLAVIFTPVMLVLALGSAIAYHAWPIFVHRRVGRDGRTFRFVKLRSLPTSTPKYIDKYELNSHRNNRWGMFLRSSHLDELPQLWLVVTGRMSLVGPRPEMLELSDTFDPLFVEERLTVRPGCTGLWQICTASNRLIGESPEYDLHYVREWTLRLDLWILARTALELVGAAKLKSLRAIPAWVTSYAYAVDAPPAISLESSQTLDSFAGAVGG